MPLGRSLLQGELSLDAVKVMRNDLSDSDLEVVRIKPPTPAPAAKPAASDLPKATPTETTWSRVTGRFLGAGKS